jgi:hypothetical protein
LTPRIYLLGPMTGYLNDNRPAFNAAASALRLMGYEVINPAELDEAEGGILPKRTDCYRRDMGYLRECTAGVALPGWQQSIGARWEAATLRTLECPVFSWPSMRPYLKSELPTITTPGRYLI